MALVLHRPRTTTTRQLLNGGVLGGVAVYLLYSYQSSGWWFDLTFGVIFVLQAAYIFWHLATRSLVFRETEDGFIARRVVAYDTVKWSELVAVTDNTQTGRFLMVVWKKDGEARERFLPMSKNGYGPEALAQIAALIEARRPGLPEYRSDAGTSA